MNKGCDMIVNLNKLPRVDGDGDIKIKRAFVGDKETILIFFKKHFMKNWVYEV